MVLGTPGTAPRQPQQPTVEDQANSIDDQGRACMDRGDYEGALACFQQAYDLSQLERYAKYYRADIALAKASIASRNGNRAAKAGNYQEALRCFVEAAGYEPGWKGYQQEIEWAKGLMESQQGDAAYQQGDLATALAHYRKAEQLSPFEGYRTMISRVRQELKDDQLRQKQDHATAANIQGAIQQYAAELRTVSVKDGTPSLDFVAPEAETAPRPAVTPPAPDFPLRDAVKDTPSDKDAGPGSAGYNVAKVHFATVTAVNPGSDTKAGDQALAAAKLAGEKQDLAPIYEGGAKAAGSLPVPTVAATDPALWPTKVRNDPRMVEALASLDSLTAQRSKLTAELAQVTNAMQHATVPKSMATSQQQMDQKNAELQSTLVAITQAETKVQKVHRTIDAEESATAVTLESKGSTPPPKEPAPATESPPATGK